MFASLFQIFKMLENSNLLKNIWKNLEITRKVLSVRKRTQVNILPLSKSCERDFGDNLDIVYRFLTEKGNFSLFVGKQLHSCPSRIKYPANLTNSIKKNSKYSSESKWFLKKLTEKRHFKTSFQNFVSSFKILQILLIFHAKFYFSKTILLLTYNFHHY